jgi:hypothetical protein
MNIPVSGADTYYVRKRGTFRAYPFSFNSERLARVLRALRFEVIEIEW